MTEDPVVRCWIWHDWTRWVDIGTVTTAFLGKKELERTCPVQERRCRRCNKAQMREVHI